MASKELAEKKGDAAQHPILIVEDSPTLALTYREYLRRAGMDATIAETGAAALQEIERSKPAIILLDLRLPDMDGLDILKQLKAEKNSARVVVISCSNMPAARRRNSAVSLVSVRRCRPFTG